MVSVFKAVRVCRCSKLCVCVDSSSLDTISRGAWPFLALVESLVCLISSLCVQ